MKSFYIHHSYCKFDKALVFKSLTEKDIIAIEKNIRERYENISSNDVSKLGAHASCPSLFKFSTDEIELIKNLVHYVKGIVDIPKANYGLKYFKTGENHDIKENADLNHIEIPANSVAPSDTHKLLYTFLNTANENLLRDKNGHRFDEMTRSFAAYLRILSGPMCYETLHRNLELALPSLSTLNRYIRNASESVVEGHFRAIELRDYLLKRDLPLIVSLSEDATRIDKRVQYDSKTNQILGFAVPLNDKTGMPIPFCFPARNFEEILKHFSNSNNEAGFANIIMAQPMDRVAPFCLLLFGSDSKYTAENVMSRWMFMIETLKKVGIMVLTISSDSDPRYNSAMRKLSMLGQSQAKFGEWFNCGIDENRSFFFVQDPIHVGVKLGNLLMKTKKNPKRLKFGKGFFVNVAHLEFLLRHFSKDQHGLTATSLRRDDSQNFSFFPRVCDDRVIQLLKKHVSNSQATVKFLEIARDVVSAFTDTSLKPLERIEKMWTPIFILRIWRDFVRSQPHLRLNKNFLTQNCYACIEMNAHSLILLMIFLKKNSYDKYFLPFLFDSQICESFFRLLRSATTVHSTVVNFSIKECSERIGKIQLLNHIPMASNLNFPRFRLGKYENPYNLPTELEILETIDKCKNKAIDSAFALGLIKRKNKTKITPICRIPPLETKQWMDVDQEKNSQLLSPSIQLKSLALKDFSEKFPNQPIDETSVYVEVKLSGLKRRVVKKRSLCWLLRKDNQKLSSDRIIRVRGADKSKCNHKKTVKLKTKKIKRFESKMLI